MLLWALFAALFYTVTAYKCSVSDGFELTRNGECYKEVEMANYDDASKEPAHAKGECDYYAALPVIIRNQEDNDYWVSVGKENFKKEGVNGGKIFLGLECNYSARWQWMDGSSVDYKPAELGNSIYEECDNSNDVWAWRCMWAIEPQHGTWTQYCFDKSYMDVYCISKPNTDVAVDEECDNFSYDGDDGVCYQVGRKAANWTEANTACRSFGATVASIHNEKENNFLRRLAVSKGYVRGLMLGGTANGDNSFKWADGTPFDYNNFAPGYPAAGAGDCLGMETKAVAGQWANINCSGQHSFACARPTNTVVPTCDGALHKEGDIIYSPGFPSSSSEPCDFLLQVAPGMLVEVEILFLEANSCCDHLVLTEGSLGGTQIAQLSGEQHNGEKYRTITQNVMRASWEPQGGVHVKGMMITFRGVPK